jgi:hypothetical protein
MTGSGPGVRRAGVEILMHSKMSITSYVVGVPVGLGGVSLTSSIALLQRLETCDKPSESGLVSAVRPRL